MVFLASCPGTGGRSYSDGATYTGGAGASGSPNGNTLSAWDIKNMADARDTGSLITLLTAGQDSGKTTPVDISIADMGLPAGTTGFKVVSFPATSVTVTENTSVTLLRNSFDVCSVKDRLNFRIYTDESYESEYDVSYPEHTIINEAIAKGYLTIVDVHIQCTSNLADPNAWDDYDPTGTSGLTNNCRLRYKLKAGGITSGEFFSPTVMPQMHA